MTFTYNGTELEEFHHPYNHTRLNERAIEIPIAQAWLANQIGDRGLEVGNVLGHYDLDIPPRTIVDRFEEGDGVTNIDLFDLPATEWDWIVAISTVEHIGWDPGQRHDPTAAARAIEFLARPLTPMDHMLITVPLGYHPRLDQVLLDGQTSARTASTMVRDLTLGGPWTQTEGLAWRPYNQTPGLGANALWIGEW